MLENVDITLKNGEVCHSKFDAVLFGKTDDHENDDGIVYITNKRIVFHGKKILAFSIAKIRKSESNPGKVSFLMENGNLIIFDTKSTFAPSVITHIASIEKGAGTEEIPPLKTILEWEAEQETERAGQKHRQEYFEAPQAKPVRRRRKSRKKKITEDIITTIIILAVIVILYLCFK